MAALPPTNVSISGQTCEMAALLQSASSSSWSICTPDSMSLCLALTPSTSWKARQYSCCLLYPSMKFVLKKELTAPDRIETEESRKAFVDGGKP